MTKAYVAAAMFLMLATLHVAAGADAPAPPAAESATTAPPCLRPYRVKGWSSFDDSSILVTAHARKFKITFVGACTYTKWSFVATLKSAGFCVRAGDLMYFSDGRFPGQDTSCMIKSVTAMPRGWTPPPKTSPKP